MKLIKTIFALIGGTIVSLMLLLFLAMIAIVVLISELIQSAPM